MTRRVLFFLAIAMSSRGAFAQAGATPKDVDGWNKVKWSMSLAEAKAAIDESQKVRVVDIELGISLSAARSTPDRYHALSQPVALVALTAVTDKAQTGNAYETVKLLLIEKYGVPVSDTAVPDLGVLEHRASWSFPSTRIVLTWREGPQSMIGFLELVYTAADQKSRDAL